MPLENDYMEPNRRMQVPGNLVNNAINAAILYSLLSNITFIRIAGFASGGAALPFFQFPHMWLIIFY